MEKTNPKLKAIMLKFQKDEEEASVLYRRAAARLKDENDKNLLLKIASDEKEHAAVWKKYTGENVKPGKIKILVYTLVSYLFGYTFTIKFMENGEYRGIEAYNLIENEAPEAKEIIEKEKEHENILADMLDEERLRYVGAIVLGLNDALVELTGSLAGLTFALANAKLIALAGIVIGISASLSMAASNYLAERTDGNPKALKASVYTGAAYLITVILLVLPYLLFPENMYAAAFGVMIAAAIFVVFLFNFYVSVAKSQPFLKRFAEMAGISICVALISFVIGILAKYFLNINV
jgi:VIT1/CCC1 family predicted Fe2+/Mn2+ transporter